MHWKRRGTKRPWHAVTYGPNICWREEKFQSSWTFEWNVFQNTRVKSQSYISFFCVTCQLHETRVPNKRICSFIHVQQEVVKISSPLKKISCCIWLHAITTNLLISGRRLTERKFSEKSCECRQGNVNILVLLLYHRHRTNRKTAHFS